MSSESKSKTCSIQCLRASIFILVLASSSFFCVEGKSFKVSGSDQSQKAVVDSSKTLDVEFDPSLSSRADEYNSGKSFSLTIGDCNLDIGIRQNIFDKNSVTLELKDGPPSKNPNGFKVTSGGVKFDQIAQSFCSSGVNFEEHPDGKGKYLLEIKIGSGAPPSFGLRSDSDLYEPSENSEVFGMSIPNWVLYVSIAVLVLLLIASVASCASYILIRNKKRKQNLEKEALKTAISAESKSKNTTSEDQKASKDKEEKTSKNDPKLDKPKKAKQEKPVLKQIALKVEQKPKDPLEQDEKERLIDN